MGNGIGLATARSDELRDAKVIGTSEGHLGFGIMGGSLNTLEREKFEVPRKDLVGRGFARL